MVWKTCTAAGLWRRAGAAGTAAAVVAAFFVKAVRRTAHRRGGRGGRGRGGCRAFADVGGGAYLIVRAGAAVQRGEGEAGSIGDHAAVGARCLTCGGRAAGPSRPLARRVAVDAQPVVAVCSATTLIGPTRLAVRLAGAGSGRAWRDDEERAAEREEEQRRGNSLCENLRAGRHWFPPLCVGHTDRGCGWLLPIGLKDSHGRMPLPFMAGSPWVRREHRPGAGPTSRTVFAALDRTLGPTPTAC